LQGVLVSMMHFLRVGNLKIYLKSKRRGQFDGLGSEAMSIDNNIHIGDQSRQTHRGDALTAYFSLWMIKSWLLSDVGLIRVGSDASMRNLANF
jgi:hypothetical protein